MGDHQPDLDVDRIVQNLAKYNRIFGGGPVSFLQVIFFQKSCLDRQPACMLLFPEQEIVKDSGMQVIMGISVIQIW